MSSLPDEFDERLSRITTLWTLHRQAQRPGSSPFAAELLHRYRVPAYRYLLAAVRNADVADDLAQEFSLRFLRGDFGRASPERGRFRDYLKASLSRLVADHYRAQVRQPAPLAVEPSWQESPPEADASYLACWREELIERTWAGRAEEHPTAYAALKLRVSEPEMTSSQMAARLQEQLGRPMTAAGIRKAVQRGHERFADLLLDEVASTLAETESPSPAALEAELRELDLLRYCRSALTRRGAI